MAPLEAFVPRVSKPNWPLLIHRMRCTTCHFIGIIRNQRTSVWLNPDIFNKVISSAFRGYLYFPIFMWCQQSQVQSRPCLVFFLFSSVFQFSLSLCVFIYFLFNVWVQIITQNKWGSWAKILTAWQHRCKTETHGTCCCGSCLEHTHKWYEMLNYDRAVISGSFRLFLKKENDSIVWHFLFFFLFSYMFRFCILLLQLMINDLRTVISVSFGLSEVIFCPQITTCC